MPKLFSVVGGDANNAHEGYTNKLASDTKMGELRTILEYSFQSLSLHSEQKGTNNKSCHGTAH